MTHQNAQRSLTIESAVRIAGGPAVVTIASTCFSSAASASIDAGALTDTDVASVAMMATIFIVLVGAMLTPTLLWAVRQPFIRRGTAVATRAGIRWVLWQGLRRLLFLLPLVAAGLFFAQEVAAQTAPREARLPPVASDRTETRTIDELMARIKASKKPLPAWAVDLAMRAYEVYKTHQNGKRVGAVEKRADDIERQVMTILRVVTEVQAQVEAGQEMTDREFRLTRELLDAHSGRLDDLAGRVSRIERDFRRPGCGFGHAWRNGRCVDVAANPR